MIGRTLAHFEILEQIGQGGMGVVYKARDTHLDRFVAIKVLPADKVADPDRRRRFVQEAKAASALHHPGIVTVYDVTQHDGIDFIAMELVPGRTLDLVIPRRGLRVNEAIGYAVQIADALAAAHAAGIVHRDLKPANVIVTENGHVKVLDFGLAKLLDRTAVEARDDRPTATRRAPMTGAGAIVGTVAYMAPEQAEGKPVDARADIFSFGAMLHEMVTGQRAFHGDTPLSTLTAVLREEPKPVTQIVEDVPHELERVITRCLRKDPERRWQAIADVRVALRELKEESDSGRLDPSAADVARPRRRWAGVVLAALALAIASAVAARLWRDRADGPVVPTASLTAVPLTTYQGREQQPAFSPDGNTVAFIWNGEAEDNWDIYAKLVGSGAPLRLTTDPAIDVSPAWSRDARWIAFVRIHGERSAVIVIPSLGGPERQVLEIVTPRLASAGQLLSWSADSRRLVVASRPTLHGSTVLSTLDVRTGETTRLTTPPSPGADDLLPSVSPDGMTLAYVRLSGVLTGELQVQPMSDAFAPTGERRRVGPEGLIYHGVTWSADGRDLLVSSGNTGNVGLWRIPLHTGQPERLSVSGGECRQPTVAAQQRRLACTRTSWDENIWRVDLSVPGRPAGTALRVIASTRLDLNAQFSPDGKRIVFESLRSGAREVWVADRDGQNAQQLTSFDGALGGTPGWSPDGKWITYDLRQHDGRGDIYVMAAHGGAPRRVTNHPGDDLTPSWSRDGRWIYFKSTRTGRHQIWKVSPQGDEPVQVTRQGGNYAKESLDGRTLYYARMDAPIPKLWRLPVSGGDEVQVLGEIASYVNFVPARDGIYFESPAPGSSMGHYSTFNPFTPPVTTIDFLSFATGKISRVMTLSRHAGNGLDVSPDGRTLLLSQMDALVEDLMLVENFR